MLSGVVVLSVMEIIDDRHDTKTQLVLSLPISIKLFKMNALYNSLPSYRVFTIYNLILSIDY